MTTHTCGAIFGPDGELLHVEILPPDVNLKEWAEVWVKAFKPTGYRFALVTVTEQDVSHDHPPRTA